MPLIRIKLRAKRLGLFLAAGMVLLAINYVWFIVRTHGQIQDDISTLAPTHTALLLGTSKKLTSGESNAFFTNRIEAVARLYAAGKIQRILMSGDNIDMYYDEPADMRAALVARGVPDSVLVTDNAGLRTLDSVVRAAEVFGTREVLIVSQRFHLERALFIAQAKNIKAYGFAARDPDNLWMQVRIISREMLARVGTVLDCYLFNTQPRSL